MKTLRDILFYLLIILIGGWMVVFQSARQGGGEETAVSPPLITPTASAVGVIEDMVADVNAANIVECESSLWVVDKDEVGERRYTLFCDGELVVFDGLNAVVTVSGVE
ncbi:MAG: hypothetical protein GY943_12195 [Chloroflexi bacterium]|nr:hypothetical protein [Chloroflexota bacterium]